MSDEHQPVTQADQGDLRRFFPGSQAPAPIEAGTVEPFTPARKPRNGAKPTKAKKNGRKKANGELGPTSEHSGLPKARGRKDKAKQEAVIETLVVKEKREHLLQLHAAVKNAAADFSDAIKAAAEKAGVQASVLRSYVTAYGSDAFEDRKRNAVQLALLFDMVP